MKMPALGVVNYRLLQTCMYENEFSKNSVIHFAFVCSLWKKIIPVSYKMIVN